uniref:CBM20 domain-containing protein n=1 Tax=Mucochytrium quahogii TaxID=96639 RepID=A0A7S2RGB1_9STRA|mmetsp:Transcript_24249/g.39323  ORF Transcript_24249/g.39323 Transcript_24249/m.39323 type:complete len:1142 (+) Transcript_24249:355-3780(+)|eukprot:CAMPEP_0203749524 /NCGR_PEP_ID=MMETSP0098-20131031/4058_1 /ASSEMBLY_ACC=CAM_ASM_000208 /TAXON_ID=96639 /ORGANISM=" , Strain NY0313808BC1" /LENGTH=1141 /DNA_ID=CAMNT_0050638597 /DNA_START=355 /DNA_END=3780 /DNA_ORIENTATION=+
MAPNRLTRVTFKVKADLGIGQNIRITGDTQSLGLFHPKNGLNLVTTPKEYPIWRTNRPVNLPTGVPLSYKYVIVSGGLFQTWEQISAHSRIMIPEGAEMTVTDELHNYEDDEEGVLDLQRYGVENVQVEQSRHEVVDHEVRRSSEPGRSVHPHVRFKLDEEDDVDESNKVGRFGDSSHSKLDETQVDNDMSVKGSSGMLLTTKSEPFMRVNSKLSDADTDDEGPAEKKAAEEADTFPDFPRRLNVRYRMFLVSFNLPVYIKSSGDGDWDITWNQNSISGKSEGSVALDHDVKWVGVVSPNVLIDSDPEAVWKFTDQDKKRITEKLQAMNCVGIFLDKEDYVDHYIRCCLMRYRDIFHNVLNVALSDEDRRRLNDPTLSSKDQSQKSAKQRDKFDGFVKCSKLFARILLDLIMENVTDRDLVWIHDYPLMLVPQLLREGSKSRGLTQRKTPKIIFFLHTPFPTSEIFRSLSVRNELLEGMLGANVVGFHTFDHARHFITSCKRFLGLHFHSQQGGRLVVEHMDRAVLIAISHVGIEKHSLDAAIVSRHAQREAESIRDHHRGKAIIVGMDPLTRLKGVPLKLLAFERLLTDCPTWRNKVVFIQHGLLTLNHTLQAIADNRESDCIAADRAHLEVKQLCERINRVYGPVVIFKEWAVNAWPSIEDRAAIWATADIMISTPIMEGLNLRPLEYAYSHRDPAGVVILSEFSAASRVLNGAIRINCYDINEISEALDQALRMRADERKARRDRDCGYISNRSSAAWTRNIILDIEAWIQNQDDGVGGGAADANQITSEYSSSVVSFDIPMHEGFSQPLVKSEILTSYKRCTKRLIILDYAGTITPRELGNLAVKRDFMGVSKRPLPERVSTMLKNLCADSNNIVFVVSGNSTQVLCSAFEDILNDPSTPLGLSAHSGVKVRWGHIMGGPNVDDDTFTLKGLYKRQEEDGWEYILSGVEDEWSRWMEAADIPALLDDYTWRTGGSSWRQTAVTTSWQFRQADPEWGGMQAAKLENELKQAISKVNVPVEVGRKKHTVELLPKGVDKGKAITYIMEQLESRAGFIPQFCFCIGDDISDETMFSSVLDFMGSNLDAGTNNEQDELNSHFGHAFTCTVGRKPTRAQYYVNDTEQSLDIIEALSQASIGNL